MGKLMDTDSGNIRATMNMMAKWKFAFRMEKESTMRQKQERLKEDYTKKENW